MLEPISHIPASKNKDEVVSDCVMLEKNAHILHDSDRYTRAYFVAIYMFAL